MTRSRRRRVHAAIDKCRQDQKMTASRAARLSMQGHADSRTHQLPPAAATCAAAAAAAAVVAPFAAAEGCGGGLAATRALGRVSSTPSVRVSAPENAVVLHDSTQHTTMNGINEFCCLASARERTFPNTHRAVDAQGRLRIFVRADRRGG